MLFELNKCQSGNLNNGGSVVKSASVKVKSFFFDLTWLFDRGANCLTKSMTGSSLIWKRWLGDSSQRTNYVGRGKHTGTADQRHVGTLPLPPPVIHQRTNTIPSGRLPNRGVDRNREEGNSTKVYTDVFEIEASDAEEAQWLKFANILVMIGLISSALSNSSHRWPKRTPGTSSMII